MRTIFAAVALCGLAFLAVVLAMTSPVFAAEVDFRPVVDQLAPVIVDIVVSILGLVGLWLAMILRNKWGIDIEAQVRAIESMHRQTLHSAVDTWTKAALDKYGPNLKLQTNNAALEFVLEGVKSSAGEAVEALEASDTWIINKAAGVLGVSNPVIQPD